MSQMIGVPTAVPPADGLAAGVGAGVRLNPNDPLDPDGRWSSSTSGFRIVGDDPTPRARGGDGGFCFDPEEGAPASTPHVESPTFHAFPLEAAVGSSLIAAGSKVGEYAATAQRLLDAQAWALIARQLWAGDVGPVDGLPQACIASEADVLSATPVALIEAIAALEDAHGDAAVGAPQLILVPRKLAAYLSAANVVDTLPASSRLWTANSTLVLPDRGFPGTGPTGAEPDPGIAWIASVGPVEVRTATVPTVTDEGQVSTAATNDVEVVARRVAGVGWAGPAFLVPVAYTVRGWS